MLKKSANLAISTCLLVIALAVGSIGTALTSNAEAAPAADDDTRTYLIVDTAPPAGDALVLSQSPTEEPMSTDVGDGRLFTIPGANVFPEGVSYDEATGKFYVGSTTDGTLYVGDVNGDLEMTVFSEGGADGRTTAVGTKVDSKGRLWVAGGDTGRVFVYDTADGSFIATITTPASDETFINDLAITENGVYFTDSFRPILWRVTDIAQGEADAWLDFTGTAINYVDGFNLNGIVPTEDGTTLIVVHTGAGELYRIDVATQDVVRIDTGTTELTAGDGLALIGDTIYVTRNSFGEIVPLELSADFSAATAGTAITSDLFGYPTTIAYTGSSFLVANSQFNNRGAPNLPFTVAEIPLSQDAAETADSEDDHDSDDDSHTQEVGLGTDLFFEGALAEDVTIQDCTLSDGTETTCYELTIAGYPSNHDVGPFCPETTSATAEDGGIWFDGNGVYDLDGAFILGLADLYGDSNWRLYDDVGNVNITDTLEAFEAAARPDVDPAYQNHCVEGRIEWLENGEPVPTTVLIPTTPVAAASAAPANGNLGVTLNGVIIANSAPVEAILSAYTIAAFDDCGGHINPVDGYHLHGARGCSEVGEAVDGETPIFAYALDGYAIHSPLPEDAEATAALDACNGHTTEADGYHYHANSAEENAVLSCFTGLTVEATGQGGRPPRG